MTKEEIRTEVNMALAGEQLSWKLMLPHLNWALDAINSTLCTKYPAFTEATTELTKIPDRYIRNCLVPGAVHHYYMVDDEGATGEIDFYNQFRDGLFLMERDFSMLILEEDFDDTIQGSVPNTDFPGGARGIWL